MEYKMGRAYSRNAEKKNAYTSKYWWERQKERDH
jgi:hypothetical protein